jgi:hypothetical protein
LKELNEYVNWLPGDELALTNAQLNLAFFNSMSGHHWMFIMQFWGQSAHTTTCAKLLHYFCVQEHKKISKDKVAKASTVHYKDIKNGHSSNHAQCSGQFQEHLKTKPARLSSTLGGPVKNKKIGSNCVSVTDKCPIHMGTTLGGIVIRTS